MITTDFPNSLVKSLYLDGQRIKLLPEAAIPGLNQDKDDRNNKFNAENNFTLAVQLVPIVPL